MSSETVSDERLAVFLANALKPYVITGADADTRSEELLGWFKRYFEGNANPKWLRAHAAELAYALQSLRSKPVASGVEVKPLEWDEPSGHGASPYYWAIGAKTPLNGYRIDWEGYGLGHTNHAGPFKLMGIGSYPTIDAAKAAAEADYRNRILSALLPKATAPVVSEPTIWQAKNQNGHWVNRVNKKTAEHVAEMNGGEIRPLFASPQPQPKAVTDGMVERALKQWPPNGQPYIARDVMRAALEAAMKEA